VEALKRAGVVHEVLSYDAAAAAAEGPIGEAAARALGLPPSQVFKTLIAEVDGERLVCAIIPVSESLDLKSLCRAAGGRRARMAQSHAAERATGYVTGGISPFGQKRAIPTFLAAEALDHERLYVSGGKRGLEIGVATEDLVRCCQARVCELCRRL
jgi:Cys-tRNA(Pro)/Cys-tRNA(Cys) deacylase